MKLDRLALRDYVQGHLARQIEELGEAGIADVLARGRQWDLSGTLKAGGTIVFPHAHMNRCGHQIATAVHACLDSGADRVLVVGVLHALSDELQDARVRVASGGDVTQEHYWGIQGPGVGHWDDWQYEFSLGSFLYLMEQESRRRGVQQPELFVRYPYLAGGKPEMLPGIEELVDIAKDAVVVTTADPCHHGIGYGEPPETALFPEQGGLDYARQQINEGLEILGRGDYWGYNQHCVTAKSDARDAGQVTRYLLGPLKGEILDLTYNDTTAMYDTPQPTWVATALIDMPPA
ncbi:MAG: hypothetical protein AAF614_38245 [Chloroflexota bacterium]